MMSAMDMRWLWWVEGSHDEEAMREGGDEDDVDGQNARVISAGWLQTGRRRVLAAQLQERRQTRARAWRF